MSIVHKATLTPTKKEIFGAWLAFFLPRFHPWKHDDRNLIRLAESDYEAAVLSSPAAA